ncbi:uncharacterized protein LOC133338590, partial [Musca vetustissima]|uniref:uncharacterized protein LOC133338590 n=1 Tax=Musca vetustissima TaxID=27455 RepID=UPI002AB6F938
MINKKTISNSFNITSVLLLCLSLLCCLQQINASTENISSPTSAYQNAGTRTILRIYDECTRTDGGFVPCLKKKAISFIDRISYIDSIAIADGVKVVKLPASAGAVPYIRPLTSENELESTLSRSGEDRDTKLTNMLIERLSNFFNGHTLQVSFPKLSSEELGRGLEE